MRTLKLSENFIKGWIIGHFSPSIYTTNDIEIGIHYLKKGDKSDGHYHKLATEYNFIVNGKAKFNDVILSDGDVFIFEKNEFSTVEYLEDTSLVVVKLPSISNDKYYEIH